MIQKHTWRHKNASTVVLDVALILARLNFFYIIKTFRFHFSFEQPLNKCELTRGFCPQEHMGDDTINLKIKGGTCKYPSLQFLIPMAYRLKGGHNYTPKLLFAVVVLTRQLTKCNFKKVRALTNTYMFPERLTRSIWTWNFRIDDTIPIIMVDCKCKIKYNNIFYLNIGCLWLLEVRLNHTAFPWSGWWC